VKDVTVKLTGVGDIKVWATDTLRGSFTGFGNILYKGNPAVDIKGLERNINPL